ncbi:MSCRAMM family protein [Bacillus paranthracis]
MLGDYTKEMVLRFITLNLTGQSGKSQRLKKEIYKLKKVDENDENIVLKDAKFDVIDKENNVVDTVTTNEKGIAEVKDLPFGDYFVKEISAPEGYIKS